MQQRVWHSLIIIKEETVLFITIEAHRHICIITPVQDHYAKFRYSIINKLCCKLFNIDKGSYGLIGLSLFTTQFTLCQQYASWTSSHWRVVNKECFCLMWAHVCTWNRSSIIYGRYFKTKGYMQFLFPQLDEDKQIFSKLSQKNEMIAEICFYTSFIIKAD